LLETLQELEFDIDLLGFDGITNILDEPSFDPGTEEEQGRLDQLDPKYIDCPNCGKEFDLREQQK
jgi:folate-dependent tRNA-U54 methylase TrmFO/GidA